MTTRFLQFICFSIIFFNAFQLHAQKVKSKSVSFECMHLPTNPLPDYVTTYSVKLEAEGVYKTINYEVFEKRLIIENLKRVSSKGHLQIIITPDFSVSNTPTAVIDTVWNVKKEEVTPSKTTKSSKKPSTSTTKSTAKETTTKTTKTVKEVNWEVEGTYYPKASFRGVCQDTSFLSRVVVYSKRESKSVNFKRSYDAKRYNHEEALQAWKEDAERKKALALERFFKDEIAKQNKLIKQAISTYPSKSTIWIYHIKKPKKDAELKMNEGVDLVKKILAEMTATKSIDELALIADDAIQNWMEAKEQFSIYDKKQKKAHGTCLHNIGATYYALDEFDLALQYLKEYKELDIRKIPLSPSIEEVTIAKSLLLKNKKVGRHFSLK